MPHFLDIGQISNKELLAIIARAKQLKHLHKAAQANRLLPGVQLAMIFEKPSTRTRASFEVGINQLGGNAIILNTENSQLGRGESISDTAKVLSRYVDLMMIRCFKHETLLDLAKYSNVPVINGLTNYSHPCQVMADIMTVEEHLGSIAGKTIAWVGDGNNMTNSWIEASYKFGFKLNIATPLKLKPDNDLIEFANKNGGHVSWSEDAKQAVKDADAVNADTWVSMGDTDAEERKTLLQDYQVNQKLMDLAKQQAIFLHCLPAHRGEEVTTDIIDGPKSVIFDEAENRLHVQKAIMLWALGK